MMGVNKLGLGLGLGTHSLRVDSSPPYKSSYQMLLKVDMCITCPMY